MFLSTSCFSYQKTVNFVWTSLLCNLAFQCHKDLCPISKGSLSISQEGHLVMLEKSKYACLPVLWIGIKNNWSCCPHPQGAKNTTKKAKKQNKTQTQGTNVSELWMINRFWSTAMHVLHFSLEGALWGSIIHSSHLGKWSLHCVSSK